MILFCIEDCVLWGRIVHPCFYLIFQYNEIIVSYIYIYIYIYRERERERERDQNNIDAFLFLLRAKTIPIDYVSRNF